MLFICTVIYIMPMHAMYIYIYMYMSIYNMYTAI